MSLSPAEPALGILDTVKVYPGEDEDNDEIEYNITEEYTL